MAGKSNQGGFRPERFVWALVVGIIVIAAFFYFFDLDAAEVVKEVDQSFETIGEKADEWLGSQLPTDPDGESEDERETPNPEEADKPIPLATDRPHGEKDFDRVLPRDGVLSVIVLDVGQGNSIFIQTPSGKTMLVDTGEYEHWKRLDGYLKSFGVTRLDAVVGSHPHSDHIGSMQSVIKNYEVGTIYMPKVEHTTNTYINLLQAIRDKGLRVTATRGGPDQLIALDDAVEIRVLAPIGDTYKDLNDYSIVLRLRYGDHTMVIPADATKTSEREMVDAFDADTLQSDVLLVAHHGSNSSSGAAFIQAVNPSAAIISLGADNDYGHPHAEVLKRLQKLQIPLYRTDELGCVAVFFTESGYEVLPEVPY